MPHNPHHINDEPLVSSTYLEPTYSGATIDLSASEQVTIQELYPEDIEPTTEPTVIINENEDNSDYSGDEWWYEPLDAYDLPSPSTRSNITNLLIPVFLWMMIG